MTAVTLAPGSESDVREVLLSETEPLHIAGGQSRLEATEKKIISTAQLNGIVEYEPGALTMVAKAGTPLSVIKDTLKKENQQLAFEPPEMKHLLRLTGQLNDWWRICNKCEWITSHPSGSSQRPFIGCTIC